VHGLTDFRVVDFSGGIAGPYCTKLMADAGADVIKVEPPQGDPLRRWSASGADPGDQDAALFRYLHHNKRAVVGEPDDDSVRALVASADLVVESFRSGEIDPAAWLAEHPGLVVLSITPFGRGGPWDARPATEFTIQAASGSIGTRGMAGQEPFQAGGRVTEWIGGTFASVGALAALHRARETGHGEHVDFSLLEVMTLAGTNYMDLISRLLGIGLPAEGPLPASVETPSIEPTRDGYVGFCTNTRQQFSDFLVMIERTDLANDEGLAQIAGRMARHVEWNEIVRAWTTTRTTAEVIELASLLRIPVAPICNGETVQQHEQLVARDVFRKDPSGSFVVPRPPYRIDAQEAPEFRPAPRLGEHDGRIEARPRSRPTPRGAPALPLAGLRILDLTAWWAGPSATHMLAMLGAEVIHVESTRRPDGMRMVGGMLAGFHSEWWECSHFFLAANTNKKGLAIDLTDPRGIESLERLIGSADAVFDNFTPRVLDGFGLTWEKIHELNPQTLFVRMPAFGLSGPWRDNTGFAQTMEQLTGLAWLTGHRDDQPRIQRGPCDPLAGMHAAFAFLVALQERAARGEGVHVECTMVEGALNAAAEQLVEFSAYGNLLQREGNRSPCAAPQGLYPCLGHDPAVHPRWLALSVETDAQWSALIEVLEHPAWAMDTSLDHLPGRRAAHDAIDANLAPWFAARPLDEVVEALLRAGVPASPVADPRGCSVDPQMTARGFYEVFDHPVVGQHPTPTVPFRYASVEQWLTAPAPTLGQHNRAVLRELAGMDDDAITALEADGVLGTRPDGVEA
jgi:crotonobetainyl-CoA:carnitine CoA-transferase CaiB-like acyl-CoA transferase